MRKSSICDKDVAQIFFKPDRAHPYLAGVIIGLFGKDWRNGSITLSIGAGIVSNGAIALSIHIKIIPVISKGKAS